MRPCRLGLAVLVCFLALWARPAPIHGDQQSAVSLYIEGRFLADDNRYEEAIKIFDKAIALDPAFTKAFVTRGYCKIHKSPPDLAGALADLTRAVELDPDSAEALVLRGEVYFRQRSYQAALADLKRGAEIDPSYPRALYNRGLARLQVGDLAGAMSDLDKHLAADSEDVWGYIGRADIRRAAGDAAGELADLNKAVQVDPKNARAYQDRGALLAKQGRLPEAKKDLEQAVALEPSNPAHQKSLEEVKEKLAAGPGPGNVPSGEASLSDIAQELLSTFSKRLLFLALKDNADPSLYRAIFEAHDGEFLEVELIWDKETREFDVSGMTAISHGKDAGEVQQVIQDYRKR